MSANTKFIRSALAAASALALMGIAPAFAADVIDEVPAPAVPMEVAPVASWGGVYAGLWAGYAFEGSSHSNLGAGNTADTDGFVGGGFLGYNYDIGNGVVLGAEGDIGYSDVSGDRRGMDVSSGIDGSLRARLGYAFTPDMLGYVTAGGAAKNLSVTEGGIKDSQSMLGWTVGGGLDIKLTQNIFARGEYRYTDYGSDTFNTGSGDHKVDADDHRVLFGVGMQF